MATDVSDHSQCEAFIARGVEEYGRIDTLINNAGIGMHARFEELPDFSLMEKIMQVNFLGSVYCTHYALQYLKETKGRIVVIISAGGKFVTPGSCGYGASKHAMVGFFDTLRMELAETGVSVTAIYPEWVATGISARNLEANGKPRGKIVAQEQGAMLPEECARLILKAAAERRRDTLSPNLKLGLLLSPIIPNIVDKIAARTFESPD